MSHPYADYLREVEAATRRRPSWAVRMFIPAGAVIVASAVVWTHLAARDVMTHAEGKVVPSQRIERVQSGDGGILREVLVRVGDHVAEGQVLARLDDPTVTSEANAQKARRLVLMAAESRLEAEAGGGQLRIPADVTSGAPKAAAHEKALYRVRQAELESNLEILSRQLVQRQSEVAVLEGREKSIGRGLSYLQQELSMGRELAAQGLKSRIELLKLERQVSDVQGDADSVHDQLPAARAAVDEAQRRLDERREAFESQALQDLSKVRADIATIDASLTALGERMARREIRAPADGVVKSVASADTGSVLLPGSPFIELASVQNDLLIEGTVKPTDLALLRPGQSAAVHISGDGAHYGVPATLEQVRPVAADETKGQPSYLVRLRTDAANLASGQIQPGTVASVDIHTGKRSVLDYLLDAWRGPAQQVALE